MKMVFYILTPNKITEFDCSQEDFLPDAIMYALQSANNKIATNEQSFAALQEAYPSFHQYRIQVGQVEKKIDVITQSFYR